MSTPHNHPSALPALRIGWVCGVLVLACTTATQGEPTVRTAATAPLVFNTHIRPILSDKCFACHGFDAKHRQGDLRLDTAEGAMAQRDGKPAIAPGKLDESLIWERINSTDPDLVMPPPDSHKSLSPSEKETLRRWIEQGAEYQRHWSFEPPSAAPIPRPAGKSYANPIDAFVADRLALHGLSFSAPADRRTMIRRVAFALTGLPPRMHDVDRFVDDDSPGAYERMVDRYLESPHFGEEMARHWLDLARYADTHGMHLDNERQTWAYRDWVIRAFNRNQPFDQFSIEQLAGDLLPNPTQDQLIATGFNRCNVTTSEGGSIDDELIFRYAIDRTSTMIQAWMGLTGGCAVCHDHKFDPISQREFYSMYAFFHSASDPAMDGNALLTQPVLKLETPSVRERLVAFDAQIRAQEQAMEQTALSLPYDDPASKPSTPTVVDTIWMDDEFPAGGKVASSTDRPTQFVTATEGAPVFHGNRALKRTDTGLGQDVWSDAPQPLTMPPQGVIYVHVHIDQANVPRAIMVQLRTSDWLHRAVWGDAAAIEWGKLDTFERVPLGPLPTAGEWACLEIPMEKLGLTAGSQITGLALTQHGGTVYWDQLGVRGLHDPAADPQFSFQAWWAQAKGKDTAGLPAELNELAKQGPGDANHPQLPRLRAHYLIHVCGSTQSHFAHAKEQLSQLRSSRQALDQSIPSTFIFNDLAQPRNSFVMMRGAYNKPGDAVLPAVPAILPPLSIPQDQARATRLDLARWLMAPNHPLTARVAVNRLWQQFFGVGLVKTSYDFGSQGDSPSHPELLDWLAIHFRDSGWDMKHFVRLILTSETYQQASRVAPELLEVDPENRLYARGPRLRLDAEQIRDNVLFVSGLICLDMGGKGVKPYQPVNIWEPVGFAGSNTRFYTQDTGSALYRRSIYTFLKRTAPPPFMSNFDAPNREQTCMRRDRSNTPLQALQLMNDVQHVEAARMLAQRILLEGGNTPNDHIDFAYHTVLGRTPMPHEKEIVLQQLDAHLARYQAQPALAEKLIAHGSTPPNRDLNPSRLAAYTLVANMILNLDETLTRN